MRFKHIYTHRGREKLCGFTAALSECRGTTQTKRWTNPLETQLRETSAACGLTYARTHARTHTHRHTHTHTHTHGTDKPSEPCHVHSNHVQESLIFSWGWTTNQCSHQSLGQCCNIMAAQNFPNQKYDWSVTRCGVFTYKSATDTQMWTGTREERRGEGGLSGNAAKSFQTE